MRKCFLFYLKIIIFSILFIVSAYFHINCFNRPEQPITLFVTTDIPAFLSPTEAKIFYEIGYGKKEMTDLMDKGTIVIDGLKEMNVQSREVEVSNTKKLNYTKNLLFVYNVEVAFESGSKVLKGGGGNYINLKNIKTKLKKIELNISYDDEKGALKFAPNYSFKNAEKR